MILILYEFLNNITRAGQISMLHFDYTKQLDMKLDRIKVYIIYIIRPWGNLKKLGLLLSFTTTNGETWFCAY